MKSLECDGKGLRFFGFDALTGESCAYSLRMLVDVTERGKKHFQNFLGGNVEIKTGTNWNSGFQLEREEKQKSVASIMIPWEAPFLADLMAFCALEEGYFVAILIQPFSIEITKDEQEFNKIIDLLEGLKNKEKYIKSYIIKKPKGSSRNTHQMSGRTI